MIRLQALYDQLYGYGKRRLPAVVAAGILFLCVCLLAYRAVTVSSYTQGFGSVRERNIVYSIQHWMRDGTLYQDPYRPPFGFTQYSPLYYLLCGGIAKAAGLQPHTDVRQLQAIGRAVSLLSDLLAALLLYRFLRRVLGVGRRPALTAAGIGFMLVYLMYPHTITSTDALKCLLVLLSLYLFTRYLSGKGGWRLGGSMLCMAAAAFTKLDALFYLPLMAGFVFFTEGLRRGAAALAWGAGGIALLSLALVLPFGHAFFYNVLGGVAQHVSFAKGYEVLGEFLAAGLVLTALSWFVSLEFLASGSTKPARFLALFSLYSFALAFATSFKLGSASAYYSDFQNVSLLLVAAYAEKHRRMLAGHNLGLLFATTLLLVFYHPVLLFFHTAASFSRYNAERKHVYHDQALVAREVRKYLRPGEYVLSYLAKGEVWVRHDYLANFLYDRVVAPNEDIYSLSPPDRFDSRALQELVDSGRLRYVVEAAGAPLRPFMGVDLERFRPLKTIRGYTIYQWRQGGEGD